MRILYPPGNAPGSSVLAHRDLAGLTLTEADYAPGLRLASHAHADSYLCIVFRGSYDERLEGTARSCEAGTVVFRPAGEPHASYFHGSGGRCLLVRLTAAWLDRVFAGGNRPPERSITVARAAGSWLAAHLHDEFHSEDSASSLGIEGLVLTLLAGVLHGRAPRSRSAPPWLGRVVDRIHADYRQALSVMALAGAEGVHPVHLMRVFRAHEGTTVAGYIRRLRLEYASSELRTSERSISEIAHAAGFCDHSHFTRTFRAVTGLTPIAYRERFTAGAISIQPALSSFKPRIPGNR